MIALVLLVLAVWLLSRAQRFWIGAAKTPISTQNSDRSVAAPIGDDPGGRSRPTRFTDKLSTLERFATLKTAFAAGLLVGFVVLAYRIIVMSPADRTNWDSYSLPLVSTVIWFTRVTVAAYAVAVGINILAAIMRFVNRAVASFRQKVNSVQETVQRNAGVVDRQVSSARATIERARRIFTWKKKPTREIE